MPPLLTPEAPPNGSAGIDRRLTRFRQARQNARRFHKGAIGDVDPDFCLADFLCRVQTGDRPGIAKTYGPECVKAALSSTSGTVGGYTVPTEFSYAISQDVADESFFRSHGAVVVPMATQNIQLPVPDATTVPSAVGVPPFWGPLRPNFALATSPPETEMKFRQLALTAWDLFGYAIASESLTRDGGDALDAWFRAIFARSISWVEDWYFLNGTGVGQPLGVINSGCAIQVTRNSPGNFKVVDSQSMVASLYNIGEPAWLMTRAAGANLTAFTAWVPNGPFQLHGIPIEATVKSPALGTLGDVTLCDPTMYVIGERIDLDIEYSRDVPTQFQNYQGVWRFVRRCDGQPLLNAAITLPDGGTTTVSPFVTLK